MLTYSWINISSIYIDWFSSSFCLSIWVRDGDGDGTCESESGEEESYGVGEVHDEE